MAEKNAEKKVKVYIRRPMDERNTPGTVVGLNGKMYTVPYDMEVEVPEAVAEILKASEKAKRVADDIIDAAVQKNSI